MRDERWLARVEGSSDSVSAQPVAWSPGGLGVPKGKKS